MRLFLVFLLSFIGFQVFPQEGKSAPSEIVESFFKAFHLQDTTQMKSFVYGNIQMKSISENPNGEVVVQESGFSEFLKSIKSIPAHMKFEEKVLSYKINSDDLLSTVWTPYEFYINREMSHCGVNNFQLLETENGWKIFSIVDTRKKICNN
jgi:hypothetical protein